MDSWIVDKDLWVADTDLRIADMDLWIADTDLWIADTDLRVADMDLWTAELDVTADHKEWTVVPTALAGNSCEKQNGHNGFEMERAGHSLD